MSEAEVLTLSEAAEYLRLCTETVSKYATLRKIKGRRIGRDWRFLRTELENFLRGEANDVSPSP